MTGKLAPSKQLWSPYRINQVEQLARILEQADVKILSTGNTAKKIRELGITVTEVAEVQVAEMLDGRVKTLPKIHGGISQSAI